VLKKAAANIRNVIETVKKAERSIGNDKMLERARQSLHKLSGLLEKRAIVLEALTEVMTFAGDSYKSAQTQTVSKVSEYRAHKTDFYGNPVHVSGAAGAAAVAGSVGGTSSSASTASSGNAYTASAPAAAVSSAPAGAAPAGTGSAFAGGSSSGESTLINDESISGNTVINNYNNTVVYNINADDVPSADISGPETTGMVSSGTTGAPEASVPSGASDNGSGSVIGKVAAGIGIAAAAGAGALGGVKLKKAQDKKKIDRQLDAARRRLSEIESEQELLRESIDNEESATDEEGGVPEE